MEKFAILILMFLATAHSAKNKKTKLENVEPEDETMKMIKKLWDAQQQQQQQQYLFSSCSQVECYEFCENVNSKITDEEWKRPFIAAFLELLEYYDPYSGEKDNYPEKEHQLIDKFLDEFVITEPGYLLFFMLKIPDPEIDVVRTAAQIQEDIEDDKYNLEKYQECMKDIIKAIENTPDAKIGQEVKWWAEFTEPIEKAKTKYYKDRKSAEVRAREKHKLIRSQIRKYKPFLKDLWFEIQNLKPENISEQNGSSHMAYEAVGYYDRRFACIKLFRHVFVGEKKDRNQNFISMTGFHNWYQFQRQFCTKNEITKGKFNFRFYTPLADPVGFEQKDKNHQLCDIEFEWEGLAKKPQPSSIMFGIRPDVEFAAFTLCCNEIEHKGNCNTHLGAKIVVFRVKDKDALEFKGSSKLATVYFASPNVPHGS